jgi:alkylhydroperoxidase family enzyme
MRSNAVEPVGLQDFPTALRERLAPRVERLGYLGDFFTHAAHQPDALLHFYDFTESLKAVIPERIVEIIALTVAADTDAEYERVQHERLALMIGMDAIEVQALAAGALHRFPSFSPAERAAHVLATCVTKRWGHGCGPAFLRLKRLIGEPVAVACLLLAGRYVAHATVANVWGLLAPVPSPFVDPEEPT